MQRDASWLCSLMMCHAATQRTTWDRKGSHHRSALPPPLCRTGALQACISTNHLAARAAHASLPRLPLCTSSAGALRLQRRRPALTVECSADIARGRLPYHLCFDHEDSQQTTASQ